MKTNRSRFEVINGGKKMKKAEVFDVAKYMLNNLGPMTTMKLQKLVYYAQAWSLAWDGMPLFNGEFQAWANGPVCPELFDSHQGRYELPENYYDKKGDTGIFTQDQKDTMDAIIRDYGDKSPQWLSNLTHQELPWQMAREGVPIGMRSNKKISEDIMQDYYGGLQ